MTAQYFLISYAHRRLGGSWDFVNDVVAGSPVKWLRETKKFPDAKYVLLSATKITAAEYRWVKENI